MNTNKIIVIFLLAILLLGGGYVLLNINKSSPASLSKEEKTDQVSPKFQNPKKSAHYESNTPEHGSTLAGVPINVVINFNFDLAKPSEIKIEKDGNEYGVGQTVIDGNKLSMRRNMDPASSDGIYTVNYEACWPDKSCHDGYFQFRIDRGQASAYQDLTGRNEVTVKMSNIKFVPMNIRISKGTKVTWVNDDDIEHYVNTESHPAHTYYPDQNSKALKKADSFSLSFDTSGIYPYHCSAHADSMKGSIVVE